eukprot:m.1479791 g.1479791  ORF g.1479791 m.1479791 type:complete len:102 (+) comp25171_c2_seq10:308-613(+)
MAFIQWNVTVYFSWIISAKHTSMYIFIEVCVHVRDMFVRHLCHPPVGNLGLAYERKQQYTEALQHHRKSHELLSQPGMDVQDYYITRAKADINRVDALLPS